MGQGMASSVRTRHLIEQVLARTPGEGMGIREIAYEFLRTWNHSAGRGELTIDFFNSDATDADNGFVVETDPRRIYLVSAWRSGGDGTDIGEVDLHNENSGTLGLSRHIISLSQPEEAAALFYPTGDVFDVGVRVKTYPALSGVYGGFVMSTPE